MHQSKLFTLLRTFEKSEWKSLRGYLIWQTREKAEVVIIYDYISQYKDTLDHKRLIIDTACKTLFKTKTRKNFLNLLSKLTGFVVDFLSTQEMMKDKRAMQLNSVLALNRRGLYHEALKSRSQLGKIIDTGPLDIWNAYYNLRASHAIQFSDNPIKKTACKETYSNTFNAFQQLVAELKLYYLLDAEHIMRISREDLQSQIELLQTIQLQVDSYNSQLLSLLIKIVKKESTLAFEKLYKLLINNSRKLEVSIGTLALLHLIHFQIRRVKKGKGNFELIHSLHEFGMQNELLFDNGKISDGRFTQWIEIVCLTDKPNRGYEIINTWSHTIHQKTRAEVVSLSLGYCHFYNGKHDASITELTMFPYKQRLIKNSRRAMLIMNYLLLYPNDIDFLLTQISNFREYIRRNGHESSLLQNEGMENFIKIIYRIVRGENPQLVLLSVNKEKRLLRRTWLRKYLTEKGAK